MQRRWGVHWQQCGTGGATEVSLSGQNWENLELTAKLTCPAPATVALLLTGLRGYDDHHEERAHATRSRGAHRIGRARHLPERREWLLRPEGPGPWPISAGEWITASGNWISDRTHGQQFKARFLKTSA